MIAGVPRPKVFVVLPTYRRDEELAASLRALAGQTVTPELTLVVDNAGTQSCRQICGSLASELPQLNLEYIDAGDNIGPAGATALGMARVVTVAADHDWILRCDDDSQFESSATIETFLELADELRSQDPMVAGVGGSGSRFDYRRCRLVKPPSEEGSYVEVDYLATNRWPLFSVQAVRSAGAFREDLFFGLTEVEFGLRLRKHGYRLYRIDSKKERRPAKTSSRLGVASWRRYYSLRNLIVIAREYCGLPVAVDVALIRALLKPLASLPLEPANAIRHLRLGARAVRDAFLGRMGRTVEPTLVAGRLDTRSQTEPLER